MKKWLLIIFSDCYLRCCRFLGIFNFSLTPKGHYRVPQQESILNTAIIKTGMI